MNLCVVCRERERPGLYLCVQCDRSLSRVNLTQGDLLAWAATRALKFERKRARKYAKKENA